MTKIKEVKKVFNDLENEIIEAENKLLVKISETEKETEVFLSDEKQKQEKAKAISDQLFPHKWWMFFSPKYWKLKKEYVEVVKSFASDEKFIKLLLKNSLVSIAIEQIKKNKIERENRNKSEKVNKKNKNVRRK